jgi:hypothetical protein
MPEEGFDQWGRYLIVPADGGKPVAHTRATTHAATLDDRFALEKWSQRMVAIGLSRRADLLAGVAAARDDDKTRIDSLVVDAIEAAEASAGRNIGQALHEFTERLDLGELALERVPEPWLADITAYSEAMQAAHLTVELVESTVVVPDLTVAGTLDRVVWLGGERYILDVKTGQSLGLTSIAIQLALYAHGATIYNRSTHTHTPMPPVNQRIGIVAHCPAGQAKCELLAVDLDLGWQGALLAHHVRSFRKAKVKAEMPKDRRTWLVGEITRLKEHHPEALAALAAQWPLGVPTFKHDGQTAEQLERVAEVLQRIEGEHRIPFGEPDPAPMRERTDAA